MGAHPSMPTTARAPDGYGLPDGPDPNRMTAQSPLPVTATGPIGAAPPPRSRAGLAVACVVLGVVAVGGGARSVWAETRHRMDAAQIAEVTSAAAAARASASAAAAPADTATLSAFAFGTGLQYSPAQILGSVMQAKEDLLRCHRTAVLAGGASVADVALFVTVHPAGFVWNVTDLDEIDPLPPKKVDRWSHLCLAGIAMSWRFPTHNKDDLAGAVVKLRFRPGTPDDSPAPEGSKAVYESAWVKERPEMIYPPYDITVDTHGRIITLDYKDGTGVCLVYDDNMRCRWVQIDSNGRMTLQRTTDGSVFDGRWGLGEDDHTAGTWKLTRKGTPAPPKPKKQR